MAAAVVAGLIPVLYSVAADKSGYYIGRQLWFGLMAMYGVVVYVVNLPWTHIRKDFWCHGNITYSCVIECFETSFSEAVVGTWYLFYFIFLTLFFLMEIFLAQIRHKHSRVKSVVSATEVEEGSLMGIQEEVTCSKKSTVDFHQEKMLLLLYLLHFLLQMGVQCVFLYFLMYRHLPMVMNSIIYCGSDECPGPYLCLIRDISDKQMSIYTLLTLSLAIIFLCLGFFVYSIHHYPLKGLSINKLWID
ncbi:Hypothetical predicted protein [Marmota monax]|uniref:Connexin N-terminal domain-containing protein n=1 Tax=Marmota monax TaxID=9995 RepID=A0A5E4BGJ9_MARMO|nr:Hypothetical predicted protein [Marmota monax]